MLLKKIIKKLITSLGFVITRNKNLHNTFDAHLNNVLCQNEIDCVLDVGANCGQYAKSLRELGYEGWIVSFEPVKNVFVQLQSLAANDKKWLCYNLALGEKIEDKKINVYSSTEFSSFLKANDYAKAIWSSLDEVSCENVSVVTLDNIFPDINEKTGAHKYYLKLDTQGYDLNVFRGAKESLNHVFAMQTEISLIHIYNEMKNPYKTLEEFNVNGFHISGMYPINRDETLAVIEFDAVLVRKD